MTKNLAVTCNDLRDNIGSYSDGLIHGHELICFTKACVWNEPQLFLPSFIEASEALSIAFTESGIEALLTRIQGSREIAEEMLLGDWSVSADGAKLSARLVLHGDLVPKGRSANDHEWIMPFIEFPMPGGSIRGQRLAEQYRVLSVTGGLVHFKY